MRRIICKYYQQIRISFFKVLSTNTNVKGRAIINQPVLFAGEGSIFFDDNVHLGYYPSPKFYDLSIYIEARERSSSIKIGKNTYINNGAVIVCDKTSIVLGENLLIGTDFQVYDSDFHGLHPDKRRDADYECKNVLIEDNVFIGNNVRILKGVTIGKNSIIANSSLVVKDIPANSIAGGNPALVIKSVYD